MAPEARGAVWLPGPQEILKGPRDVLCPPSLLCCILWDGGGGCSLHDVEGWVTSPACRSSPRENFQEAFPHLPAFLHPPHLPLLPSFSGQKPRSLPGALPASAGPIPWGRPAVRWAQGGLGLPSTSVCHGVCCVFCLGFSFSFVVVASAALCRCVPPGLCPFLSSTNSFSLPSSSHVPVGSVGLGAFMKIL